MAYKIFLLFLLTLACGCATMPGTLNVTVASNVEDVDFTCSYEIGIRK